MQDELDNKLSFLPYSNSDDFSKLDFKWKGNDELGVHKYIHDNPSNYVDNHVSAIFTVRHENKIIGFFTLSMSYIGKNKMLDNDALDVTFSNYPAILLGQMGIDLPYRGKEIGEKICSFCRGIGQDINERVACAFLILQTTAELAKKYYEPQCHFKWKAREEGIVWMYRKLF